MYCRKCGQTLPDNARRCPVCKTVFTDSSSIGYQKNTGAAAAKKSSRSKWWIWVIVIVLAAVVYPNRGTILSRITGDASYKYKTELTWAELGSYQAAVEIDDFNGDILAAGKYAATPDLYTSGKGKVPIVWDLYVSDNNYSNTRQLQDSELVATVGGIDHISAEFELKPGQYLYIKYNDTAGDPTGALKIERISK